MNFRVKRRMIGAAILVAAVALAATGCGAATKSSGGGNVKLKLVAADYGTGPSNTSQTYWEDIAKAFHAANSTITVEVQTINWNDFDNQVQTMIQNQQYVDITEGDYFSTYAQEKLLYPASDVLSEVGNLLPVFAKQGTYDGVQYGMPFTTSSRTLFYNKKLFAQAGITSAPQTWTDIQTDAAKIKALGKIGFGLPLGPEEAQGETLLWFLGNGGGYQTASGQWDINSPQNVKTFQFLQQLVDSGGTEPHPGTQNRTNLWKQFAQGQIGMINGSPALIPIIQQGGVLQKGDWASVAIAGKNGPLSDTLGVCDNVAAFNPNGHKAAIKKFLDFAYQDKYQLQFAKEYYLLPATNSASKALASDSIFGSFIKALPHSVQYPTSDTAWPQVRTQIQQTIGTAITSEPKSVLDTLQQTAKDAG